jgi:hypothetical protein
LFVNNPAQKGIHCRQYYQHQQFSSVHQYIRILVHLLGWYPKTLQPSLYSLFWKPNGCSIWICIHKQMIKQNCIKYDGLAYLEAIIHATLSNSIWTTRPTSTMWTTFVHSIHRLHKSATSIDSS